MKPGYAKMLQTLYDHELSFHIRSQWDSGFDWSLGWPEVAHGITNTAAEAIEKLWDAALKHYPEEVRISLLESVYKHD